MAGEVEARAAEPMSFFPHDTDAAQDVKCRRLIRRRGFDGYGRWWRLCEHMALTKGHVVAFQTDEDVLILADVLGFGAAGAYDEYVAMEDCKAYIADLVDIGLLEDAGDGTLRNARMLDNALYFGRNRANGAKGGRPRKGSGSRTGT